MTSASTETPYTGTVYGSASPAVAAATPNKAEAIIAAILITPIVTLQNYSFILSAPTFTLTSFDRR
jgi:hypothetical protein